MKIMAEMPENSVDLVFGSPPYEDARDLKDDPFPVLKGQQWVDWMIKIYLASLRVSSGLVAYVIQGRTRNYRWSATPVLLAADLHRKGVHLRDFLIYHRYGIPGSGGPDWMRHDCEYILCATNGGKLPWSDNTAMGNAPLWRVGGLPSHRNKYGERINRLVKRTSHKRYVQEGENYIGKETAIITTTDGYKDGDCVTKKVSYCPPKKVNPGNLVRCKAGGGHLGSSLAHRSEAPFPESLARFMILSFCKPQGTVLDPFCGSGTTCAVAKKEDRGFIGIDIRKSQIVLSKVRLTKIK